MGSISETFDYASLKELLKDTKADILLPSDGQKYEDIIQRWSESCVKRAVRHVHLPLFHGIHKVADYRVDQIIEALHTDVRIVSSSSSPVYFRRLSNTGAGPQAQTTVHCPRRWPLDLRRCLDSRWPGH
jgi:hypothetical protein